MKKLLLILIAACAVFPLPAQSAARTDCFPFERLASPAERQRAAELLLKALDTEALYTLAGGLKPLSSGFLAFQFPVREPRGVTAEEARRLVEKYPDEAARRAAPAEEAAKLRAADAFLKRRAALDEIEAARRIFALWRCGEDSFFADVQHFARVHDGTRYAEAVLFNRRALRETITSRAAFFSRWAVTPASHPLQALYAIEADETGARFGGYGYLFGYPDEAVNFFVAAAAEEEFTGRFVERDFYPVETFSRPTGGFVWAVPKGRAETEADRRIKDRAGRILAEYKKRRAAYIGEGKRGPVELVRDWFCPAADECRPPIVP